MGSGWSDATIHREAASPVGSLSAWIRKLIDPS